MATVGRDKGQRAVERNAGPEEGRKLPCEKDELARGETPARPRAKGSARRVGSGGRDLDRQAAAGLRCTTASRRSAATSSPSTSPPP